jgi:hypothetical protein
MANDESDPPNLFLRSALARLRAWTELRAAAELRGDKAAVADAERFIGEYNALIETAMAKRIDPEKPV